jgi:hypothetical protein
MGSWINYWRIIKPEKKVNIPSVLKTDSDYFGVGAEVSAVSWYNQVMRGVGSRMQKYRQFDLMDTDIDISRALDTIAEEIGTEDNKTHLPFVIDYQNEDNQEINENIVTTIRAAVRFWSNLQDLKSRIFSIARTTVKYGDCFFKRVNAFKTWEYIDPSSVIGIEVNSKGQKIAYHISRMSNTPSLTHGQKNQNIEIIPAEHIIHFSLTDMMGPAAPFGDSILLPVLKTYKQLSMLEDAMVIYRIVRAPERRVFYIDVGNMPAQRVKQYLEQVKNDVRQKRMPNPQGDVVDGTYNPACLDMNTRIPLLDGRILTIHELAKEYESGKINYVYSCDPLTGEIKPGEIIWAGVTRKNADVLKITFDNGKSIICTPDHKFPVQGLGFVRADELIKENSLIPFNRRWVDVNNIQSLPFSSGYEEIFDISKKEWIKTHKMVSNNIKLEEFSYDKKYVNEDKVVVHHKNFNKHDNTPNNLILMGVKDHFKYHADFNKERFNSWNNDKKLYQIEKLISGLQTYYNDIIFNFNSRFESDIKRINSIKETNRKKGKLKLNRRNSKRQNDLSQRLLVSQKIISLLIDKIKNDYSIRRTDLLNWMKTNDNFLYEFKNINKPSKTGRRSIPSWTYLEVIKDYLNVKTFSQLKYNLINHNHKIVKIEYLKEKMDVGCITIGESIHNYHTFATECGVFTKNSIQEDYYFPVTSSGRGSRVETLPGGENLGESADVKYFQEKIFRGLRIPTSYMRGSDAQGAQIADGKVGIAYIEELRFANYIKRLQNKIERVLDQEFKLFLKSSDIKVDNELFLLKLPDPQNFALYRQAALDAELINTYNSAEQIKYLSRRFILKRYLGFTEDDIQMNEAMLKQERGISDNKGVDDLQQIYNPYYYESPDKIEEINKSVEDNIKQSQSEGNPSDSELDKSLSGELENLPTGEETPPSEEEQSELENLPTGEETPPSEEEQSELENLPTGEET